MMACLRFAALALLGFAVRGAPAVAEDHASTSLDDVGVIDHDATNATTQHTSRAQISANYVFTAFTDQSESNLYVYTSSDAVNFDLLAGPTYTPASGLIRDPSVVYWNDQYYLASMTGPGIESTADTTDWTGTNFAIASSTDMKTWTLFTTVSTASNVITPQNTWAPEFFQDPKDDSLNIVVSLSTGSYGPFLPYVYTATDDSLKNWSGPTVMSGISNAGLGYIDTFPVYYNNEYHIFTKAESNGKKHIEHAVASSLTGPYEFVQTGDFAGWGQLEGPCVTRLDDGTFRLFADGYSTSKYVYTDSSDLYNWTATINLPGGLSGFVRHGTVLNQ